MNTDCEQGAVSTSSKGEGVVSDPDATIDSLIAAGSVPNLAGLYRAAKNRGLIPPVFEYGLPV